MNQSEAAEKAERVAEFAKQLGLPLLQWQVEWLQRFMAAAQP